MNPRAILLRCLALAIALTMCAAPALADDPDPGPASQLGSERWAHVPTKGRGAEVAEPPSGSRWGLEIDAAYLRQFETDTGDGGRFGANRLLTKFSLSYRIKPDIPLTLWFGYRYDHYDFTGTRTKPFPVRPWEHIHSPTVTLPFLMSVSERWKVLGGLSLGSSVEGGVPLEDGLNGGIFAGGIYKVNERLSIGPGVGVLTQIEDSATVFPIVLVDWKIRPNLTLKTGSGLGSTQAPGLFLEWQAGRRWSISAGGRYDRLRFRLDDRGAAPGGVGEETSYGFVAFARFEATPKFSLSASLGVSFAGDLRLEDRRGRLILSDTYDAALLAGIGFSLTL